MTVIRELTRKWDKWFITLNERLIWVIILLAGLVIAIASGVIFYDEDTRGDENYYYQSAIIIKAEPLGWLDEKQIGISESLNSIVQGYSMLLPGNDYMNVYLIQIILYALTGLLVYRLSRFLMGREGSLVVLLFYWVNNKHWLHIYNFKPGVWSIFLLTLCVYIVFSVLSKPGRWQNYLWLGIISAVLLLADMRYLPHLLLMYFILLFTRLRFWTKLKYIVISAVVLIAILVPWTIRQYKVFDKFIIISDINMLTIDKAFSTPAWHKLSGYDWLAELSNEEFVAREVDLGDSLGLTPGELIYARHQARGKMLLVDPPRIEDKYADVLRRSGMSVEELEQKIAYHEQMPYVLQLLRRAGIFLEPVNLGYDYDPLSNEKHVYTPASRLNNLNRLLTCGLLLPFLIFGLIVMCKRGFVLQAAVIAAIFLAHTAVHALTYVQWRYMLPIMPVITLGGVYGLARIYGLLRRQKGNVRS
jgi:4-amino-4-deoxy-L-arabinose transferase-like glycosyltransferase